MTTIPFPDQWRPMHVDVRRSLSVQLDDCWVHYTYDTANLVLSIDSRVVLDVDLDEDGRIDDIYGESIFGTVAPFDVPVLMQAIPHFYAASGDKATDERKSIRAVYRLIAKLAVPA